MRWVVIVSAALLAAAAVLALIRAERGPSMLDRTIALDVLTGCLVASVAVEAAWSRRIDTIPILVALSLVGFVGSVTIARFASVEPEGEGKLRTREEIAAERAALAETELAELREHADPEHHGGSAAGEVRS